MSPYVLGILAGVAMLWLDCLKRTGAYTIKGGKWLEEKNYLKKWEGTLF
jgi:hypothetical protein